MGCSEQSPSSSLRMSTGIKIISSVDCGSLESDRDARLGEGCPNLKALSMFPRRWRRKN